MRDHAEPGRVRGILSTGDTSTIHQLYCYSNLLTAVTVLSYSHSNYNLFGDHFRVAYSIATTHGLSLELIMLHASLSNIK